MKRNYYFILIILLLAPGIMMAQAKDIEATTKLKSIIVGGSQVIAGVIALLVIISTGFREAIKSLFAEERSSADNKNILTKLGTLVIGLVLVLFAPSIVEFIQSFL